MVIISRVKRNPYVTLLCEGLSQPDLCLAPEVADHFSLGWVWRQRGHLDVLHIHWLELLFTYPTLRQSLKRWLSVMLALLLARLSGTCIIYTLHNLEQHEGHRANLTRLGHRILFALAHGIHVHDDETAATLGARWGRRRGVYVIPHGNYVSAYANECSRAQARDGLNLPEENLVFLCLGRVRPYKGIEDLIAAFRTLEDPDAILLIAGEAQEPEYAEAIRALASEDSRVRLQLDFVAEDELQFFFKASDISVLPYRHVTTSGAAILSFSFLVPIIAPRLGCFAQWVGENERGLLYDPDHPEGLKAALAQVSSAGLADMRRACQEWIEALDWRLIARKHAAMYKASCAPRCSGPGSRPCGSD
ncbi:MAG: glycosyltransferase, partial [Anaerolineae bacterium]|nr:glycosyltransferase [Anaerolineae bacterium]